MLVLFSCKKEEQKTIYYETPKKTRQVIINIGNSTTVCYDYKYSLLSGDTSKSGVECGYMAVANFTALEGDVLHVEGKSYQDTMYVNGFPQINQINICVIVDSVLIPCTVKTDSASVDIVL